MELLSNLYHHDLYWLFLGLISFATGVVTSIGGAGGLVLLPFMIGSGVPPQVAIASAKFSSFGMWCIILSNFNKAKLIAWKYAIPMAVIAAIGGFLGGYIAVSIDESTLLFFIGFLFLILGALSILNPDYGIIQIEKPKYMVGIGFALYLLVITISGFFPAGMSILLIFTLVTFFGLNALQAHATDIFPWIIQTIASTIVFWMHGLVDYSLILPLFIGLVLGGKIGSKIAIKKGAKFVKIFISVLAIFIGGYWVYKYGSELYWSPSLRGT